MTPIRTAACNKPIGRESPIVVHADPVRCLMHSYWQPSEQDISNILDGKPIRLTVFGRVHPPVAIAVTTGIED